MSAGRFHGNGKVEPNAFFPPFAEVLHDHGIGLQFVDGIAGLERHVRSDACTIHVYKEEGWEISEPPRDNRVVFNSAALGRLISRKDLTNAFLAERGIKVPRMIVAADDPAPVFVNDLDNSGSEISRSFDPDRYNTAYVDTAVDFNGSRYNTTVRLLCVGRQLIHCNVGARDVRESASVHGRDVPLDAALIEYLTGRLIHDRKSELTALAGQLGSALAPGFFGHDLVICRETGDIFVTEVGFKFDARAYKTHLQPIAADLPSHATLFSDDFARRSALAFVMECQDHGLYRA